MKMLAVTQMLVALLDTVPGTSGCYDRPSEDIAFPYLTLDGSTELPWDRKGQNGSEVNLVVHTWSRSIGKAETYTIQGEVNDLLHQQSFVVDGASFLFFLQSSTVLVDPDDKTFHGVNRYQVLVG